MVTISFLFVLFWYVASFLQCCNVNVFRKNATVFTVTLASIYVVYLTWSAMASNYDSECQLNMNDNQNTVLQIIIGLIFTFITVISIAVASHDHIENGQKKKNDVEIPSVGGDLVAERAEDCKQTKEEEIAALFPVTIPTVIFQGVMCLTMMYFGMLFSNWGDAVIGGENDHYYGSMAYT